MGTRTSFETPLMLTRMRSAPVRAVNIVEMDTRGELRADSDAAAAAREQGTT
jgi:hypothetical protein